MSTFFSRPIGEVDGQHMEIRLNELYGLVTIEPNTEAHHPTEFNVTAQQAKAIGRALIKAGKFAEKARTP